MKFRSLAVAVIGLGAMLAAPVAANAYTSFTTGNVNQRAGPSTGYARMGTLGAGSRVDVRFCRPGWCSVRSYLGSGWVSSSYLSRANTRSYRPRYAPPPRYYGPRRGPGPYPYYRGRPRSGFSMYFGF